MSTTAQFNRDLELYGNWRVLEEMARAAGRFEAAERHARAAFVDKAALVDRYAELRRIAFGEGEV